MSVSTTKLAFNLWAVLDGTSQLVYALCGRAYNLSGSDEEKLFLLKQLSATDHVNAKRHKVPERFVVTYVDGERLEGFTYPQAIHDKDAQLFEEVFRSVVSELPPTPTFTDSGYLHQTQIVPDDPLCVSTLLYENDIGEITPIITEDDRNWLLSLVNSPL